MRAPWLLLSLMIATGLLLSGCSRRAEQELVEPVPVTTPPLPSRTLHVFCYHGVEDSPSNTFFNRTEDFAAQMQVLADEGFHCINCMQWAQYLAGERDLPDKPVLLTFDDGNISVYDTVHPILQRHGFTATLFVYGSAIGNQGHMSWEQLKELHSLGYEVGSHTVTHANLTKFDEGESLEAYQARIVEELTDSKTQIENAIGEPITALAYPYGNYDEFVMAAARDAGYRVAFSIDRGAADERSDAWRLPRQMVVRDNSLRTFKRWLTLEPLHLTDISPPVGQVASDANVEICAKVTDDSVVPDQILVEGGKQAKLTTDDQTGNVVISTTLSAGANNIRLQYQGSPPRETSWVMVHRP
jgi:peptidoglycan/xylan/chitin deacetylase (PgdA/CDA1 family)